MKGNTPVWIIASHSSPDGWSKKNGPGGKLYNSVDNVTVVQTTLPPARGATPTARMMDRDAHAFWWVREHMGVGWILIACTEVKW